MLVRSAVILLITGFMAGQNLAQIPPASIEGQWIGKLTQDQGGYRDEYEFELYIIDNTGNYSGRTYVHAPNVLGVLYFEGQKRGKVFYLTEKELIHSRKPNDLSWCFKTMQLRLVQREGEWFLEGPWRGISDYGTCIPGWLSLQQKPPRV